jgi:methylmalonyl-CoA mutase C-terminal domain
LIFWTLDNTKVRDMQIDRLKTIRASRDEHACQLALQELERAAREGGNLLEAAVPCARARATVGEISDAMERVFGRHQAEIRSISGVYGAAYDGDDDFNALKERLNTFTQREGRRPRMLVAKLGQDGHDRGAKVIATAFADVGFDIDVGPLFQTPAEAALDAIDNDVHIVGVSSQAAGHKTLVPELIEALRAHKADNILVVCGGVIPAQDYQYLRDAGVAAIFGPGTSIPIAAQEIIDLLEKS